MEIPRYTCLVSLTVFQDKSVLLLLNFAWALLAVCLCWEESAQEFFYLVYMFIVKISYTVHLSYPGFVFLIKTT